MLITSLVLILTMFTFLIWHPMFVKLQASNTRSTSLGQQIILAQTAISKLKENSFRDVNKPYEEKITALNARLKAQQRKIDTITSALVNPKKMPEVFSKLLNRNDLTLESLSNADAQPINISTNAEEDSLLFKHSLSLEMKGQFLSGLNYIKQMEKQDWQLYWDEFNYVTKKYPQGVLTLKVHALSTSDNVLVL